MTSLTRQSRPWTAIFLIALLLPQCIGLWLVFPHYAFTKGGLGMQFLSFALALLAAATLAGLWLGKVWAMWTALVLASFLLTLDLFAWSSNAGRGFVLLGITLLGAAVLAMFCIGAQAEALVSPYQRVLFGIVFCFAAWVAIWGLVLPLRIGDALPIKAPPLHARFLGSMYLSGATFMLLGALARSWAEVRIVTVILAVWTGVLGVVSLLHLALFDWTGRSTWFWMIAYIAFPLIAAWIAWNHRRANEHPAGPRLSALLRSYLYLQGAVAVILGLFLLVAPQRITGLWPWPITATLAQFYGAPFLAYGVGSLYAAQQQAWSEARIALYGSLVFTIAVLISSLLHRGLFNMGTPSAWVWFGGIGFACIAMLLFSVLPVLRERT